MATQLYGYLIVDNDMAINTLPDETEDYALLPGSIAFVIGGGAYILTPSYKWVYLDHDLQKLMLPVFDGKASSGGGGGGGGGGASGLVVNITITEDEEPPAFVCDKTWQEMWDAAEAGGSIIVHLHESEFYGFHESYIPWGIIGQDGDEYYFAFYPSREMEIYCTTDSPSGYPLYLDQ